MITWTIRPLEGVGPIDFGMTRAQVKSILGPVESLDDPDLDLEAPFPNGCNITEFRVFEADVATHAPIIHYHGDCVNSIEFVELHETLQINGVFIFKNTMAVTAERLKDISRDYVIEGNEYIFLDLGISLDTESGLDTETVNIFAAGEFDEYVKEGLADGTLTRVRA